jgi:Protein of unknown function (DUF1761)
MYINEIVSNIHWLPVVVMTFISFAIGAFWHSSLLFGKRWKAENSATFSKDKINAPLVFGGTALFHFIALAGLSGVTSGEGWSDGLLTGLVISLVWVLPTMAGTYLFANRSLRLLAIDTGMYIFLYALAGLAFGAW